MLVSDIIEFYCSVTCFSENLRCMCHPKDSEVKYRIAAKATPRKVVAKAGHTLDMKLTESAVVKAVAEETAAGEKLSKEVTNHIAKEMATEWKEITEVR